MEDLIKLQEKYGRQLKELIAEPAFFIENFIVDFKLTDYQKEWLHLSRTNPRLVLQAFRSSGKTEVLAALYNEILEKGGYVPCIRWLFHRHKSPSVNYLNCIANLNDLCGSGGQADALSVSYILQEAYLLAKKNNIYLLHLTDLGFCSSFKINKTPHQEVIDVIGSFKRKHPELCYIICSLGQANLGLIEDVADYSIILPPGELQASSAAEKVGVFVADIIRVNNSKSLNARNHV